MHDFFEKIKEALRLAVGADIPCTLTSDECAEIIAQLDRLDNELEQHRWIPVSERLPDEGQTVIALSGSTVTDWMFTNHAFMREAFVNHYTHWMPLPSAPEVSHD